MCDTRSGKAAQSLRSFGLVGDIAWHPDEPHTVALANIRNAISFVDLRRGKAVQTLAYKYRVRVTSVCRGLAYNSLLGFFLRVKGKGFTLDSWLAAWILNKGSQDLGIKNNLNVTLTYILILLCSSALPQIQDILAGERNRVPGRLVLCLHGQPTDERPGGRQSLTISLSRKVRIKASTAVPIPAQFWCS